jgi:phosphatidylserine/phosphatidylglycerophosphate/cardiolipin synthase-like enzyme
MSSAHKKLKTRLPARPCCSSSAIIKSTECQPIACRHLSHRKILTVDGNTGFIGGMNVGDEYSKTWHDIHSEVTGSAVADLQHLFENQWDSLGGTMKADYPDLPATGSTGARIIGHVGHGDENMKLAYLRAIDTSSQSITIADPYEKVAVFDHRVATIGSSNLDRISLEFNDEANVWGDDRKVAGQLDAALDQDQKTSVEVTSYHPNLEENAMNHVGNWLMTWV